MTVRPAGRMAVTVAMIVMMVVPVVMVMMMTLVVARALAGRIGIGTALGFERRGEVCDRRAEPLDHGDQHMVVANAEPAFRQNLQGRVAVADVPGDARRRLGVAAADFRDWFGRRLDRDDAAALERETVAIGELHGVGEVEQERLAGIVDHPDTAPVAVVESQGDGRRHAAAP